MPDLLAPASYWILIILWSAILVFYFRKLKQTYTQKLFFTLILILLIDAFRTLFESVYFGLWYTSLEGLLPASIYELLTRPYMVVIPKAINIAVAVLIIGLLIKRWIPQEEQAKQDTADALKESEARFRAFTSQSVDGIGVATMAGEYTYVNSAFCSMTGYSEAELLTMKVFDLRGPSQPSSAFRKTAESDILGPQLVYLQRKDGSEFLAEIMGSVIRTGESESVLGVVRDVTERERSRKERRSLELQVQHGQKLESLGVLAGGIAHDFNNVLTAILGNASLASLTLPVGSSAAESLREIESAANSAAELTKQMLDYSGKGRFVVEAVDAPSLVKGIMQLLAVSVSKKIDIHYEFDGDTPHFDGDAGQIRQVVMNLITNASEAIGDNVGKIRLSTGAMECSQDYLDGMERALRVATDEPLTAGKYAYIEVEDTGCGMDEETRDKVFDPFFTTKFTGRGLGMSSVIGILRGHGAGIHVDTAPGEGTTIRVLFPASSERFETGEAVSLGSAASNSTGARCILIADDERSVRRVGERMLEQLGYEVLSAVDGEEALRLYREHADRIACVLLDLTMPRMDGAEALRELRTINAEVKVIVCSGYSEQDVSEKFEDDTPNAFLHKPFSLKKLEHVLQRVLDGDEPSWEREPR